MMYAELYRYFILYKRLSVPGIGTFLLERMPAETDFPNRQIKAPSYSIAFANSFDTASRRFFKWLGHSLGISERDAVMRFNDFAFDMKKQITAGTSIEWKGLGILSKGLAGEIKFIPHKMDGESPVAAEKVIRERAEHMVRVGENEKTSFQMTEMLKTPSSSRSLWWVYALTAGVLAFIFIGWYLSEHGMDISSIANTQKLVPLEPPPVDQLTQ